jgi:hypothetical protein
MRRSQTDYEWAEEVVRRYQRRRWGVQRREKAIADIKASFAESALLNWVMRALVRVLG